MKVGVPKEVKNNEFRVAITPAGVHELARNGHEVFIEKDAGVGSSIPDDDFVAAGAQILPTADDVWQTGDLILKVKEPVAEEYHRMREGQMLFTYLHLAASRAVHRRAARVRHHRHRLRDRPAARRLAAAAGADVRGRRPDGTAGRCAPPAARRRRSRRADGRRLRRLRGQGVVIGAGVSGMNAAAIALGMQAEVLLLDKNIDRLRQADAIYQGHCQTVASNIYEIERAVIDADLVIGAVLVPGAKAPKLVTNELVSRMKPGAVLVDISIDQGGCFEDSHPTTHADPTYQVHDSIFYCVANMPGAVPHTSTYALTNVTLPYAVEIANRGWREALRGDRVARARAEHPRGPGDLRPGRRGARPAGHDAGRGARLSDASPAAGARIGGAATSTTCGRAWPAPRTRWTAYRRDLQPVRRHARSRAGGPTSATSRTQRRRRVPGRAARGRRRASAARGQLGRPGRGGGARAARASPPRRD